jgi:hypothetical protein
MNPLRRKPKTSCAMALILFVCTFWGLVVWGIYALLDRI